MSVFVPVTNGLQVSMQFTDQNGDILENNFWVKRGGAWTLTLINAMCAEFVTWFGTGDGSGNSYRANMNTATELSAVAARDHTTISGLSTVYQVGLPIGGSNAHAEIAPGLTKSFTLRTGFAGKSYRGRIFACGIGVDDVLSVGGNELTGAYLSSMTDALTALIASVTSADAMATLVVCSRFYQPGGPKTPTVPRAAGITTPVLSVGYPNNLIDFQRRRAPGHARHN